MFKQIISFIKTWWFALIIPLIIIYFIGYGYITDKQKQIAVEADAEAVKTQVLNNETNINDLVSKNKALRDWSEDITSTIQLQEKIINKPTLFRGEISDIYLKDEKTFIKLDSYYEDDINYVLELDCDKKIVDKIRNRIKDDSTDGIGDNYAIVAKLDNISKASIRLVSEIDDDYSYIDFDSFGSDLYLGKGKCVDFAYIEDANIDFDLFDEE